MRINYNKDKQILTYRSKCFDEGGIIVFPTDFDMNAKKLLKTFTDTFKSVDDLCITIGHYFTGSKTTKAASYDSNSLCLEILFCAQDFLWDVASEFMDSVPEVLIKHYEDKSCEVYNFEDCE